MSKVANVDDLLKKANAHGEIGYAYGGDDHDLQFIDEAVDRGWIKHAYDATPGIGAKYEFQRRDVYKLTASGRDRLDSLNTFDSNAWTGRNGDSWHLFGSNT